MPRLRLRAASTGVSIKLELPQDCTWAGLLAESRRAMGLPPGADIILSLNKKAPLQGSGDEPLSLLGICGGDLVWVLSPQPPSASALSPEAAASCQSERPSQTPRAQSVGATACAVEPPAASSPPILPTQAAPAVAPPTLAAAKMPEAQSHNTASSPAAAGAALEMAVAAPKVNGAAENTELQPGSGGVGGGGMEVDAPGGQVNTEKSDDDDMDLADEAVAAVQALPGIRGVSLKLLRLLLPSAAAAVAAIGGVEAQAGTGTGGSGTRGGDRRGESNAVCIWTSLAPAVRCLLVLDCALTEAGFKGLQDLPALVSKGCEISRQLLYDCAYITAAKTVSASGSSSSSGGSDGNSCSSGGDQVMAESASSGAAFSGDVKETGSGTAVAKLLWYGMGRYLVVHGVPCIISSGTAAGFGGSGGDCFLPCITIHIDLSEYDSSPGASGSIADGVPAAPSTVMSQQHQQQHQQRQQQLHHQPPRGLGLPPDPAAHWRRLNDGLVLPLLTAACRAAALPSPLGLTVLPLELQMAVLRRLEARELSVLSSVCTALHHLAAEDELWRPLYEKEFGAVLSVADAALATSNGYKYLYGRKWRERSERRKRRQLFRPVAPSWGPPPLAPFLRPPVMPPGSIGGDYDRLPSPLMGGGPPAILGGFGGGMFAGVGGVGGRGAGSGLAGAFPGLGRRQWLRDGGGGGGFGGGFP